jgi:hypothetical protein
MILANRIVRIIRPFVDHAGSSPNSGSSAGIASAACLAHFGEAIFRELANPNRDTKAGAGNQDAGPVAIGGPSAAPHSVHEPS